MNINIKKDYKQTVVGIIPKNWKVKRLGSLCSHFKSGMGITSKDINDEDDYPVYGGNGLRGYTSTFTHNGKFLLIGRQGALCGNIQKVKDKNYISEHAIAVQTNSENDLEFLACKLEYFNLNRLSESSAQPGLAVNKLVRLKLPIPPLPEQKAIANCLSTWDKGIEKLSALIASKKEQKKGLMQQLLTGKKRLDGFKEEWKEVRLEKYFKERNQRGFNDLDLLSIGEEGVYPQSDSNKKDTSNSDKSKYKLIEIGDLGYNTMRLWQGRIALSNIRGIVSPAYTILIPKIGKVNSNYFSYLFKMPFVVNKFYRSSQGMVSDTLTCRYNDFKKIKLIIPSIEEQVAIAQVITTTDKEIELLEQKLASFKIQKKGLMQVLLTGKKRLV